MSSAEARRWKRRRRHAPPGSPAGCGSRNGCRVAKPQLLPELPCDIDSGRCRRRGSGSRIGEGRGQFRHRAGVGSPTSSAPDAVEPGAGAGMAQQDPRAAWASDRPGMKSVASPATVPSRKLRQQAAWSAPAGGDPHAVCADHRALIGPPWYERGTPMEWQALAVVLDTRPHGEGGGGGDAADRGTRPTCRARQGRREPWPSRALAARQPHRGAGWRGWRTSSARSPASWCTPRPRWRWSAPLALAILRSATAVAEGALPEREAHPRVPRPRSRWWRRWRATRTSAMADLVRWEAELLADLGYGLDFALRDQRCHRGLAFVSPRSGRPCPRLLRRMARLAAAVATLPAGAGALGAGGVAGGAEAHRPFPGARCLRRASCCCRRRGSGWWTSRRPRLDLPDRNEPRITMPDDIAALGSPAAPATRRRRCAVRALPRLCAVHHRQPVAAGCAGWG